MDGTDAPKRDSMGQLPACPQPSNSSASTDARKRLIGELALRFPGSAAADRDSETARLRLLMADTAHLSVANLGMAIRAGAKTWKFMPTAAEICAEAKFFVEMDKVPTFARPEALPDQSVKRLSDNVDADKLLRDTIATLNAGHNKLTGGTLPGAPTARSANLGPPRAPTPAEIAELRAMPSRLPVGGASAALKAMLGISGEQAA